MPGLDLFGSSSPATANTIVEVPSADSTSAPVPIQVDEPEKATETAVSVPRGLAGGPAPYYNARLDPKNFLEGPLSWNPATRLRQMLARPGIVVRTHCSLGSQPSLGPILIASRRLSRLHPASAMVSARAVRSRPALTASTRGALLFARSIAVGFPWLTGICVRSGAATTASRLGQPDVAIATLNDFVQVSCNFSPLSQPMTLTHTIHPSNRVRRWSAV